MCVCVCVCVCVCGVYLLYFQVHVHCTPCIPNSYVYQAHIHTYLIFENAPQYIEVYSSTGNKQYIQRFHIEEHTHACTHTTHSV